MRYFADIKAGILLDNSNDSDPALIKKKDAALIRSTRAYYKHLDKIATRLGKDAYRFFRFGFGEESLHDGVLVSLSMGDGITLDQSRLKRLRFGSGKSVIEMRVLSFGRDALHTFTFRKIKSVVIDIPSAETLWFTAGGTLGHVYTYEIVAASPKYLRNEWLLDSGGTIVIECQDLKYKHTRI